MDPAAAEPAFYPLAGAPPDGKSTAFHASHEAMDSPSSERPGALVTALALAALALAACESTPEAPDTSASTAFGTSGAPQKPIGATSSSDADRSLGKYMADLDALIRAWMDKTWTAASREDRQKQDQLELHLETQAKRGKEELLTQLETGPVKNRIIAATALGFTRDPAVLSPLVAALDDPDLDVEQNALIGLSLLLDPDTPLEPILVRLRSGTEPALRASAAYCLRCLVETGARAEGTEGAARAGLVDPDPIVRSQCALVLAVLLDGEALENLGFLLSDDVELVAAAAARAIAYLGKEVPELKGKAARALTDPLEKADERRRSVLLRNLVAMAEKSYGDDLEAWSDWSHRLP